ncbi:ABC transporter ATP-binding protein [Microvirga alba]|uniref:ABC transporter ATP-binding protein n=1 Tax=Microvirga alba TaxID=2791025 RepID=A0A931FQN3_9HYPH|nr:ABC transporter ATP-binding protein [Microvirga alba]MBF9233663.1 ABC transporter ATP-binding protein [Microvirga alba]
MNVHAGDRTLRLDNVTCVFDGGYVAVKDASLTVNDGEFICIVGPTGCGKSTLLNVAAGLLEPSRGNVSVFGQELTGMNKRAGYMFQAESLMPWRTALDNVALGLEIRGVPVDKAREQSKFWLEKVGLAAHKHKYPHQLSGGMRKRASLAQMLILNPEIILMDEPFGALDVQTRQLMENELLRLWSEDRKIVLFITHDLEEAIALADRVIVMSAGPAARPIGNFSIDLPRPRDVAEVRLTPEFLKAHSAIWDVMREEVLKSYKQFEGASHDA